MSDFMYKEKNPLLVILIGLMDENKILLAKRKREPYAGYWGILGGRQTFGKSLNEIVKKEVYEETGCSITDKIDVKGFYSEILLDRVGNPRDHFVFIVTKAWVDKSVERNSETENTDIEKFRWFDFPINEDIKSMVIPTDLIMLENFNSNKLVFKEFVMRECDDKTKLKILKVR